jgi:hypothetical protein
MSRSHSQRAIGYWIGPIAQLDEAALQIARSGHPATVDIQTVARFAPDQRVHRPVRLRLAVTHAKPTGQAGWRLFGLCTRTTPPDDHLPRQFALTLTTQPTGERAGLLTVWFELEETPP